MIEYFPLIRFFQIVIICLNGILGLFIIGKYTILFIKKAKRFKTLFLIIMFGILSKIFFVTPSFINTDLRGYKFLEEAINIFKFQVDINDPFKGNTIYIIYNILFKVFGVDEKVVFYFNLLLCCILSIPFYILVKKFMHEEIALYSSFLFVIFPPYMKISVSEEFTSIFLLFTFLSLITFLEFVNKEEKKFFYYFIVFFTLLVQTQIAGFFLLSLLLLILVLSPRRNFFFKNYKVIIPGVLLFVFMNILSNIITIYVLTQVFPTSYSNAPGMKWINTNIHIFWDLLTNKNFNTLLNFEIVPFIYILLFLAGGVYLILKKDIKNLVFLSIGLAVNAFLFFSGHTLDIYDGIRYQGCFLYLFLIFCGIGLYWITNFFKKRIKYSEALILVVIIFTNLFISKNFLLAKYNHNIEHQFFRNNIKKIPADCTIVRFSELHKKKYNDVTYNFPDYLVKYHGNDNATMRLDDFLTRFKTGEINLSNKCFVLYKGLVFSQFFVPEFIDRKEILNMWEKANGATLYKTVNELRGRYKKYLKSYERPEFQVVKKEFHLEPIVEKKFINNSCSWQYTPAKIVSIGFYKLTQKNMGHASVILQYSKMHFATTKLGAPAR